MHIAAIGPSNYCAHGVAPRTFAFKAPRCQAMAARGRLNQEIYEDEFGIDIRDRDATSRCFVHIANGNAYERMTGQPPPSTPITEQEYHKQGIP